MADLVDTIKGILGYSGNPFFADADRLNVDKKPTTVVDITSLGAMVRGNITSAIVGGDNFFYASNGYTVDNGTVFAANGGGYWVRKLGSFLTPEMFGGGIGVADNRVSLQAAIDSANALGIKEVRLQAGTYTCSAAAYSTVIACVAMRSNIKLIGAPGGTTIKVANGSFTLMASTKNRIIINDGYNRNTGFDHDISIENITFDANPANQTADAIFGVVFTRVINAKLKNVSALNCPGTGTMTSGSLVESFAILFSVCKNVDVDNCYGSSTGIPSASGMGDAYTTDITYRNCVTEGFRAQGYASYLSANVRYNNCNAYNIQSIGFNQEQCFDAYYTNCQAGGNTVKLLGDGFETGAAPFTLDQNRAGTPGALQSESYGFRMYNTRGGNRIQLVGCSATGWSTGTGYNAGLLIQGVPGQATVTAVSSNTVTVSTALFEKHMESRKVFFFGLVLRIKQFISPTQVILNNAPSGSAVGQTITVLGAEVSVIGGTFVGNDVNIRFSETANGLIRYACRTTRIDGNVNYSYNARTATPYSLIGPCGPNVQYTQASGMPVDAFLSSITLANQPAVPASGSLMFNDFPFDIIIYLSGGTNVVASVSGADAYYNAQYGSVSSGQIKVPAGGRIKLTYDTQPAWQAWAGI
ncbi:glycosyl hydrolase family 28-related protein [Spirosoma foliorum]|uniref:Rhamnogalacturonase A/B/Epimerase-like pectate lyase domain-containing protein n=1 Tax=Spirosoma foliorum TaxID=2710596 RepID=A0A7G5H5F7_9BACT|nr:hypothetical protein [Spirosoma foliorum]QMW06349.1 hypothetical protein H3H32_16395 [Spirosoma foliorum]